MMGPPVALNTFSAALVVAVSFASPSVLMGANETSSPGSVSKMVVAKQITAAVLLLLACVAGARGQECFAIETDYKYNIPQGVYGTNGGCVKGTIAQGSESPYCKPNTPLSGTNAMGSYSSLAACCAEVESRTRVDPRNGQPMPDQANVKAACLAYKKPQPAAAAAPAAPAAPKAQECFAIETDYKYNIPQGVYGTNGGCVKGTVAQGSESPYCKPNTPLSGTNAMGSYSSLAACCAEVESRTRVDPRNGQPMPDQANVKAACLAYKKPQPAAAPAAPKAPAGGKMCYGLETDSGYKLLGIWATYGGCVKGVVTPQSSGPSKCVPTDQLWGGNTVDGNLYHDNLANCCAEVESRTGHAGVKGPCLAYKKAQPAAAPAPAAPKAPAGGKLCYGLETDSGYKLLGIWATYGGCVKGVVTPQSSGPSKCKPTDQLWGGNTVDGNVYHDNLANCCAEVESRTGHAGVKGPCLAYKKAQVTTESG